MADFRKPSLTHPLARARGMGSAKDGTSHWVWQRLTAIALIPTSVWFLYSLLTVLLGTGHATAASWASSPLNSFMLVAFFVALCAHAKLGIQVVIEDYIRSHGNKNFFLALNTGVFWSMGIISLLAIGRLHFMAA